MKVVFVMGNGLYGLKVEASTYEQAVQSICQEFPGVKCLSQAESIAAWEDCDIPF